jgi:hypothetical protein
MVEKGLLDARKPTCVPEREIYKLRYSQGDYATAPSSEKKLERKIQYEKR